MPPKTGQRHSRHHEHISSKLKIEISNEDFNCELGDTLKNIGSNPNPNLNYLNISTKDNKSLEKLIQVTDVILLYYTLIYN